ncbi:hypothetical protein UFOVP1483_14 [uncultured Caudovirales phage]|uniref:Uncharacterized protein n=1 Tax=uncultured Caudovirales phage TaxID=2100421 RepID=A0A6J5SKN8_9CAUD|nr:hypothetical protein UFOVP1483_14 [uncultured Caudovirales phage]
MTAIKSPTLKGLGHNQMAAVKALSNNLGSYLILTRDYMLATSVAYITTDDRQVFFGFDTPTIETLIRKKILIIKTLDIPLSNVTQAVYTLNQNLYAIN